MSKNPLRICDTTLRDAHQSLLATRWRLEDMLPKQQVFEQDQGITFRDEAAVLRVFNVIR